MYKDLSKLHDDLARADPCFKSVPIDDSDDSQSLRTAHAQRIISNAICDDIWKPFVSELTLPSPEFSSFLCKISDELEKPSYGGRTAKVWTAFTMRALQSLQAGIANSPASQSNGNSARIGSTRADLVISKVSVIFPLVSPSQTDSLHKDLLSLIDLSVNVWDIAQAGGLKIIANPLLDRALREEWRSQQFDPISPLSDSGSDLDLSKTRPRVFTLFPRVIIHGEVDPENQDKGPPGSWPTDSDHICIHPGLGLPEWSPLVVRGKDDQEEKNEFIANMMENAMKELNSSKRGIGHTRRLSRGSSVSIDPRD